MKSEERLHRNLQLWSEVHPREAVLLQYVDCEDLIWCQTRLGEPNLKRKGRYYHSQAGAEQEAARWFSKLNLRGIKVLYIYGVGLGYYYDAAKSWLRKGRDRHLVFLEDDPVVIHRLLETERGTRILRHPRVHLFFLDQNLERREDTFIKLYWTFIQMSIGVTALKLYEKTQAFEELHHKVVYDQAIKYGLVEEYMSYGLLFYKNFYANLLHLQEASLGNSLFGKFKNVPAIICGAGPSLQKNRKFLGSLLDRALIFAGGSSMNALNAAGILPHFGAALDPNPAQLDRIQANTAFGVPYFYRNRLYHDACMAIKGPRLYLTGAGGFETPDWFEQKLGIKSEYIEEGHNVVNMCVEVARKMGCNPIIFVGMDLAYTDMQQYAEGVVERPKVSKKAILAPNHFDSAALLREDIHGKPVYTLWKWIAESRWISDYARDHPEITLINATEGGLGMEGIPNRSLKQVAKQHLTKRYNLKGRITRAIKEGAIPQVTRRKITRAMKELSASLERSIAHLDFLSQSAAETRKKIKRTHQLHPLESGKTILHETELAEEPAYRYVLEIFNAIYNKVATRDLLHAQSLPELRRTLKSCDIAIQKYTFLSRTAQVNLEAIRRASL